MKDQKRCSIPSPGLKEVCVCEILKEGNVFECRKMEKMERVCMVMDAFFGKGTEVK